MELSAAASSPFRFRDDEAAESDTSSDISTVSSDGDENSELQSMTGKGIRRLCMELLEIKEASDEDFHANIFSNYSAFIGIDEEVKDVEKELMQLRHHVAMQKMLVKDLLDGVYLKVLDSISDELVCDESFHVNELEFHVNNISETLDVLLSENRANEAIAILEMEQENLQRLQFEDDNSSDVLKLYNNAISERKAKLTMQLTHIADNSRISASELQKVLVGICRLGQSHLATQLLLKYYHSRIASGIHNLQRSYLQGVYIRELSKFVFSMISQAARSFVMLYGETSAYASEFIQWVQEEIEVFSVTFTKYVKSISEISGGLSTAVESLHFATSYCSLLQTQRLVLQPLLVKHLCACMEEVLAKHIEHFKKVISIFTASDTWVLGRYVVSGILQWSEDMSSEYCLLTNSGRKFVTLLQAVSEDVTFLAALKMEGSVLAGLSNLFMEYIAILEKAITCDVNMSEKVILAESMSQQVSILANLSTLGHFFCRTVTSISRAISCIDSEKTKTHSVGFLPKELESCVMVCQEASNQLRAQVFLQFINRVLSTEVCILAPEMCDDRETNSHLNHGLLPSSEFQVLFLELRKLSKLSEDSILDANWLLELIRELIQAVFAWISNNKQIWETNKEDLNFQNPDILDQFVLDMHFLVEATREYFSNDPLVPEILMKEAFNSAGVDPFRDNDDGWAMKAATEAIEKLMETEITELLSNDEEVGDRAVLSENHSEQASETFQDAARSSLDISSSEEGVEKIKSSTESRVE